MHRHWIWAIASAALAGAAAAGWLLFTDPAATARAVRATPAPAVPVTLGMSERKDVPVYLSGLGVVQASNTVTVHVRVDGELTRVHFVEGQDVKAGDLLAEIDPMPFEAALEQAVAKKGTDAAQLANARRDLERYTALLPRQDVPRQTYDTQRALVAQLEATIKADEAVIKAAEVQLRYTRITAPLSGRTGMRLVDQGNIVHAADPGGLVVITQLQPISVVFTLPQAELGDITREMKAGTLTVGATAPGGKVLDEGTLLLVDNMIDQATGMVRLKATFPNEKHALWPGQFVNGRLLLRTLHGAVTVPSRAVQRGPDGMYVYVVNADSTVRMQPVGVARMEGGTAVIEKGLDAGVPIVVSGQYRLEPGTRVRASADQRTN